MGWNQYVILDFSNNTTDYILNFSFPNTSDHWGYPFAGNDPENRKKISYEEIRTHEVQPGEEYAYGQTGKQNEWAGMSGRVMVWATPTAASGIKGSWTPVCGVDYDCPWSGRNSCDLRFDASNENDWEVTRSDISTTGALGRVNITVKSKKAPE